MVIVFIFAVFLIEKISFPSPEKNIKSTLLMKLKSFNYLFGLLIFFFSSHLLSEEKIDIWKNKKEISTESQKIESTKQENSNLKSSQTIKALEKIQIQDSSSIQSEERRVYGIYEPASYDFDLNMWSTTKAEDLRSSLKRLNKIELSKSSTEILEAILFSFSYPNRYDRKRIC